jgi:exopolysaccharide biosynthesis polyprenyl glycosylphosphotransferase
MTQLVGVSGQSALAAPAPANRMAWVPAQSRKAANAYRCIDTIVAVLVLLGVLVALNLYEMPRGVAHFLAYRVTVKNLLLLSAFAVVWPLILTRSGMYARPVLAMNQGLVPRAVVACTGGSLIALVFPLSSTSGAVPVMSIAYFWVAVTLATIVERKLIHAFAAPTRTPALQDIIIVGSGPMALRLYQVIAAEQPPCHRLLGFVDTVGYEPCASEIEDQLLGTIDDLEALLMRTVVDGVLIALPVKSRYSEIQRVIDICERAGVECNYLAHIFRSSLAKPRYYGDQSGQVVSYVVAPDDYRLMIKRAIDIAGAVAALVVFAPVMIAAALAVAMTSPGPILFRQERYGLGKRRFTMYKFRTMVANAEALQSTVEALNEAVGPIFKIRRDPRMTPIGRWLRSTSIDELPQLFNVLRGEMSLVGPRPMSVRDVHQFSDAWLMRRFSVRPGITGLWQVSGRSHLPFDQWIKLDLRYIDSWSLSLDLKILVRTVPAVIRGHGAA